MRLQPQTDKLAPLQVVDVGTKNKEEEEFEKLPKEGDDLEE